MAIAGEGHRKVVQQTVPLSQVYLQHTVIVVKLPVPQTRRYEEQK